MKEWDHNITKRRIRRLKRFLQDEACDLGPNCLGLNGYAVVDHYKDVTRTLKKLLKYAALPVLLIVAGCTTNFMPRTIHNDNAPPDLPPLPSMDEAMPMPSMRMNAAEPLGEWPQTTLAWNYDVTLTNAIGFRVYGGRNVDRSDWTLLGETHSLTWNAPRWERGFFGVKAVEPVSGMESDWGTAQ
jgi:hypothetical protein